MQHPSPGGRPGRDPGLLDAFALAARAVDEVVVETMRDTHDAIARRVHGLAATGSGWAETSGHLHRGVARSTYHALGLGLRGAAAGLSAAASAGVGPALEDGARGRLVRGAVNGLWGDRLDRERHTMAITMAVRVGGRDLPLTGEAIAAAFPSATGRVAVLVHGLGENDSSWRRRHDELDTTYADTLTGLGWTPVLVRANTGLSVRENGAALAALLDDLTGAWPVRPERIALVGHSLGGLIARAAGAVRGEGPGDRLRPWQRLVTDVVTLGTPHTGAPTARAAARGSDLLGRVPETAPLGRVIDRRSQGIDDLREGLGEEVPPLPQARYRLVSATVGRERAPMSRVLGDLLVRTDSARGEPWLFADGDPLHLDDTHHFALLNHPEVHRALERWLGA